MGKVIPLFKDELIHDGSDNVRQTENLELTELSDEERDQSIRNLCHRDRHIQFSAKAQIIKYAEQLLPVAEKIIPEWKNKVTELIELDNRTNRFAALYLPAVDTCECLSAVGKWTIQNDKWELARLFLYLELESQILTGGRRELSSVATDFLDFCGYTYFLDYYPEAIDYMLSLLDGECAPQVEKPARKVFARLCSLKQHDRISQIMLSSVVAGDLGKVDWFTSNLYPVHFQNYGEYERALIDLIASESMPRDVRENAVSAMLFISEELLLRRKWFREFAAVCRESFSRQELEILTSPENNPKVTKILTQSVHAVRS